MEGDLGALVRGVQQGEPEAFERLYRATSRNVYWTARKLMRNETDAEDVVQQVYMKLFESIHTLKDTQAAGAWIAQITRNTCLTELKRRTRREERAEDSEDALDFVEEENSSYLPEGYVDDQASRAIVVGLVDALPEAQARVVYLYYFSDLSVAQIAAELEISEGTVKSRLSAARAKIRLGVEEEERRGNKLFAFPALGLLLRQDAEACTLPRGLEEAMARQIATATAGTAPAGAGAVAAGKGLAVGAKLLAVAVVGAAVIGGGALIWQSTRPPAPPAAVTQTAALPPVATGAESPAAVTPSPTAPPEGEAAQDAVPLLTPEELLGQDLDMLIALYGEPDARTESEVWDCYSWQTPNLVANTGKGVRTIECIVLYADIPLHGVTPGDGEAGLQAAWGDLTQSTAPFQPGNQETIYMYSGGDLTYQANVRDGAVNSLSVYPAGSLNP